MGVFLQAVAGALVATVISVVVQKQSKDFSLLLTLAVSAMVMTVALGFIQPVVDFIQKLSTLGDFDSAYLQTILKAVGIALIAEITESVCSDSGNAALGKGIQFLAGAVILWLSIPVFTAMIELVQKILEGV